MSRYMYGCVCHAMLGVVIGSCGMQGGWYLIYIFKTYSRNRLHIVCKYSANYTFHIIGLYSLFLTVQL